MPKKILVVEDNADNRKLLLKLLEFHGYEVIEAENGIDGIKAARGEAPDLILMDIQMPVMDGTSAMKTLKQGPDTAHMKIIAVTSFAMRGDREKALSDGFDEYITKPIDIHEVVRLVDSFM
jgi:two-component system cell cycle response regulator DivK